MVGEHLGRFFIIEQVGAGGMGVVYRGRDEHLDRDVALKVLPPSLPADPAARRRFRQEALALSRLNHPNIATVYDFVSKGDRDLLVMEFVPGLTLSERLRSGPLPDAEVIDVGLQLAAGLQCAHDAGVIHRDLKPSNLRLTDDGRLKILDFGLARLLRPEGSSQTTHTSTDQGRPAGTLPYMAPEQLRGELPGVRTDIYSAGATLYELATGRPPFCGTQLAMMDDILHRQPPPPSSLTGRPSPRLDAILLKALEKPPERRYGSAGELAADLECVRRDAADRHAVISRRGWLIGTGASALVGMILWTLPTARQATPFQPRGWILITDFDNRTEDSTLARVIPESLAIALHQSAYVNVVPRERQFEALKRMKRADTTRISEDLGLELCRREGFPVTLAGSVSKSGDALRIVVRALEADTGRVMFAESTDFRRQEQLFDKVDELARKVRRRLGESLAHISQASEPLERVTTGSLEALRRYSQASDAFARGELERAVELLQGALLLDGEFAMAHRVLAWVYSSIGERTKELEHLSRAYDLRSAVSIRERHLIEGSYFAVLEQYEEAERRFSQLATLYPDDDDARYELARARYAAGNSAGAIAVLREQALRPTPAARVANMLVPLLATTGAPEEALELAARASAGGASSPSLHLGRGLALFAVHRLQEARAEFHALAKFGEGQANIGRLYVARVDMFTGRLREASTELASAIRRDREAGRVAAELLRRYLLGRIWLLTGRAAEARKEADAIAAAPPEGTRAANLQAAALLYVWSGHMQGARLILRRLLAPSGGGASAFQRSCVAQVRGELALNDGRKAEALAAFNESSEAYPNYLARRGAARTNQARGDPRGAAQAWRDVLHMKGEILRDGFAPDWVIAHYDAARVLAQLGDRDAAATHLRQFLELWQEASSDLRRSAEDLRESLTADTQ